MLVSKRRSLNLLWDDEKTKDLESYIFINPLTSLLTWDFHITYTTIRVEHDENIFNLVCVNRIIGNLISAFNKKPQNYCH